MTSDAREIKGIGGLDSIGVAKGGANIRSRVEGKLMELYSHKAALSDDPMYSPNRVVESLLEPNLDAGDATDEWWTNAFNSDKTEDVSFLSLYCLPSMLCVMHILLVLDHTSTFTHVFSSLLLI